MQGEDRTATARRVRALFEGMLSPSGADQARQRQRVDSRPPQSPQANVQAQEGLYIISVAARILAMHPQTLRKYERVGLVRPSRTIGMLRLYSEDDIAKLRMIKHLVDELRLNLAGVEIAMAVFDRLSSARHEIRTESPSAFAAFDRAFGEILSLFQGRERGSQGGTRGGLR